MNALSLIALGDIAPTTMAALADALWKVYDLDIRTLAPLPAPAYAFDAQRNQYSSARILAKLITAIPAGPARVLAVTDRDLFIPMLSFVFGHAQFNGRVALISLARLSQEYYQRPEQPELSMARAIKEAVHEIGHTFGLTHCPNARCPMSLSNTIFQVDGKTEELCKSCSILLEETLLKANHRTLLQTEKRL